MLMIQEKFLKVINDLDSEFKCFDQYEIDRLNDPKAAVEDLVLTDKDWQKGKDRSLIYELQYEIGNEGEFDYRLTWNGFGDISIEDIDKIIDQLNRKKKIMEALASFRGKSIEEDR